MTSSCVEFPSTHWSFVSCVRDANSEHRRDLINDFLIKYMMPLRAHIARQFPLIKNEDREDLLQDFVASRILQQSILNRALKQRGRLRSLLCVSLNNFIKIWLRQHKTDLLFKATTIFSSDFGVNSKDDPAISFDLAWARFVLAEAVNRLKDECNANGRQLMWDVFDLRILRPIVLSVEPVPYQQLSNRCGLPVKRLENLLITARRAYSRKLRQIISVYTASKNETEEEIQAIWAITSSAANIS